MPLAHKFDSVYVTYLDRFSRFGSHLLRLILSEIGIPMVILAPAAPSFPRGGISSRCARHWLLHFRENYTACAVDNNQTTIPINQQIKNLKLFCKGVWT